MKFGIGIPTSREGMYVPCSFAGPKEIVAVTQMAEDLGFYSVWGTDFTTHTKSMGMADSKPPNFYELLICLSYLAAATRDIKLGAGTIVLPHREPVLLAKQVSTLDVFSGGRVLLGVGLGHYRDEFEALRPRERQAHRGRMLLEGLEALNVLLTQEVSSFKGEYYEFQGVSLHPKPVQRPLPIYISGKTPDTPHRVARWGNGWLLSRMQEKTVHERIEELASILEVTGRDISEIDLVVTRGVSIARTTGEAWRLFQTSRLPGRTGGLTRKRILAQNLIGTPDEVAEQVERIGDDGINHLIAEDFAVNTFQEMMEQVQMFGEEVMPVFRPG